ncbi:hypothetical protein [Sediminibacillus halophilus]|uniref:Uncharacterized protein n=1 Tax=Sediminibacillus halophilus TaxID=482461 RepID=A0A1G9R8V6_9BACI|nr:hypothetical protein [Sediminibacillus halophilus]SDM19550.1 hypothetical protein SAMN05216244_1874 [Sediminibacillus halophilus]
MTEEKKRLYFYTILGYFGVFLVAIMGLRFILASDSFGQFLALLTILALVSYIRYAESELPFTRKEKRIFTRIYYIFFFIIVGIGAFLIYINM